jgi:hypothetical protein
MSTIEEIIDLRIDAIFITLLASAIGFILPRFFPQLKISNSNQSFDVVSKTV